MQICSTVYRYKVHVVNSLARICHIGLNAISDYPSMTEERKNPLRRDFITNMCFPGLT